MPHPLDKSRMRAVLDLGDDDMYTLSVVYGEDVHGKGPAYNTYEVAVVQAGHEDFLPLQCDDDVLGWQNDQEITGLMKVLQTESGFGDCLRILKRTKYYKKFNNISQMRDEVLS